MNQATGVELAHCEKFDDQSGIPRPTVPTTVALLHFNMESK